MVHAATMDVVNRPVEVLGIYSYSIDMLSKKQILFLCTGNSCRSQMAEGILNKIGADRFEAYSAGSEPAGYVHPMAIETMATMGIDISKNSSKSLDGYLKHPWNLIITVCDNVREACPVFPGHPTTAHWGFEDPAKFDGTDEQKRKYFQQIALEIEWRIRLLLALPEAKLEELEYEHAVRHIGTQSMN
jgi:arsenate reductase